MANPLMFFVAASISFLAPIYTLPALLAGVVECYVIEEWVHHSCHFYNFRNPHFIIYIKRYHFYHHSPKGMERGYGLTNGFWDIAFKTRYPFEVRRVLYDSHGRKSAGFGPTSSAATTSPLSGAHS